MMVKRKTYFRNPISRQNFANAFAETPDLNLEVRLICFVEGSRADFTFKCLLYTNALNCVTVPTIVGNCFVTVFAVDFPMRFHVCPKLPPPLTCDFTLLTFEHTLIMLCLNVHLQKFV